MSGITVLVVAHMPSGGVADFARYEDAVLPLLRDHGGELQRRLRSEDGTTEVHLVGFPSADAYVAYRADPRREEHAHLLAASGARVTLHELRDVS